MSNNPNQPTSVLPWTQEQYNQMKRMLNETIPMQEDNLRRSKQAGLNVDDMMTQLADQKQMLSRMLDAWKDKYK